MATASSPAESASPSASEAPSGAPDTGSSDAPDKLTGAYTLTLRQQGGIAGMNMETVIDTASRHITYGGIRNQTPETRDLTDGDIEPVTRALEAANFSSFPGKIKGPPIADAFSYSVVLKVGSKEYSVSWSDGATVPESVEAVQTAVDSLRTSKFSSRSPGPKGAPTM